MQENAFIVLSFVFLIESKLRIVMTNVIVQIANRIQKPPGGAGFCLRWVKMEHRILCRYIINTIKQTFFIIENYLNLFEFG